MTCTLNMKFQATHSGLFLCSPSVAPHCDAPLVVILNNNNKKKHLAHFLFSHPPDIHQTPPFLHWCYATMLSVALAAASSTQDTGTCDGSKDKSSVFFNLKVKAKSQQETKAVFTYCVTRRKFCSHLLFRTCGFPLSPSPPLIFAVPIISIIRCFCLAWHPTAGILLAGVMQLYTHTYLFYPEYSFSSAITQSYSTGANQT